MGEMANSSQLNYRLCASVFFTQFLLSPQVFVYSLYDLYTSLERKDSAMTPNLWTPMIYCTVIFVAKPWLKDLIKKTKVKVWAVFSLGACLLSIGILSSSIHPHKLTHNITYGLLGGIGACIMKNSMDLQLREFRSANPILYMGISHTGSTVGLVVMISALYASLENIGTTVTFVIHATFLFFLIPILILTWRKKGKKTGNDEATEKTNLEGSLSCNALEDVNTFPEDFRSWKSPSDGELHIIDEDSENSSEGNERENSDLRNGCRYSILSEIAEEDETMVESETCSLRTQKRNSCYNKRLSVDSVTKTDGPKNFDKSYEQRKDGIPKGACEINKTPCSLFAQDWFFKPIDFFLSVLIETITLLCPLLFFSLLPYFIVKENGESTSKMLTCLLLAVIFQLFTLVCVQVIADDSKEKTICMISIFCALSGFSFHSVHLNLDTRLACSLLGLCQGIVTIYGKALLQIHLRYKHQIHQSGWTKSSAMAGIAIVILILNYLIAIKTWLKVLWIFYMIVATLLILVLLSNAANRCHSTITIKSPPELKISRSLDQCIEMNNLNRPGA